jgi:hypothetical protein
MQISNAESIVEPWPNLAISGLGIDGQTGRRDIFLLFFCNPLESKLLFSSSSPPGFVKRSFCPGIQMELRRRNIPIGGFQRKKMWVSPAKWGIQRAEMGVAKLKR